MHRLPRDEWTVAGLGFIVAVCVVSVGCGPSGHGGGPWFDLELPPGLGNPHQPVLNVTDRSAPSASVPEGEAGHHALESDRILDDVGTITGFSRADRAAGNQMWGRVTGRPAAAETMEWVAKEFRDAGLRDVEVQAYDGTEAMWWPRRWQVRLFADPVVGAGSEAVVLESALPTSGSEIPGGVLTAALVDVGSTAADALPDVEVAEK
ncbi:MAG: hypothetical protein CL477_07595 [Acidobacteria bacterium]|nr:hypothetical protein [Acidobacteriota bacterium]